MAFEEHDDARRASAPLLKIVLSTCLVPILRVLSPSFEKLQRLASYLRLSSQVNHPVPHSVVTLGTPEIRGTGNIRCGQHLLMFPDLYLETQNGAMIDIGDDVVISRGAHLVARAGITIGAGSMIGEYTSIRDANHVRDASGSLRKGPHFQAPILIGSQVWIGRGVTVLPGVSIGDNATVGANAVVTRDVAAGTIVVGVPAAPIHSARDLGSRTAGSSPTSSQRASAR